MIRQGSQTSVEDTVRHLLGKGDEFLALGQSGLVEEVPSGWLRLPSAARLVVLSWAPDLGPLAKV